MGDLSLVIHGVAVAWQNLITYHTVSASMFTFWDYLLTFSDEVDLIWRAPLSWVSVLFYVIRYLTFVIRIIHLVFCTNAFGMIPVTFHICSLWRWFQVLSGQFLCCAVEILLVTRVYAFYGRNKKLLVGLLLLLAGEFSGMVALVFVSLPNSVAVPNPIRIGHISPCIGISQPKSLSSLWIPPLLMQTILCILVVGRFFKAGMKAQPNGPSILKVFIRDHIWAFLLIFALCVWAVMAYEFTEYVGEMALTWTYSVMGFVGARLILNLRSAAREDTEFSSTLNITDEIKFTSPLDSVARQEIATMNSTASDVRETEQMHEKPS